MSRLYRIKPTTFNKKTCGNCLYLAMDDDDKKSNCVIEFMRDNIVKEDYPRVTIVTKACEEWKYYGEYMGGYCKENSKE